MRLMSLWAISGGIAIAAYGVQVEAEVKLNGNSEIVGQWLLESVAPSLDKAKVAENRTWEFRADGVLVTSGYNRHFSRDDTQEFKYQVVDGKIKADNPGRPGKTLDYSVYEKTSDSMILQGGLEGFYFFKKK